MRYRLSIAGLLVWAVAVLLLAAGCDRVDNAPALLETDEPGYRRAKELVRQEREGEALIELDKVLAKRGLNNSPETHLEMAIIYQTHIRDHLAAIYHYKKYLSLRPRNLGNEQQAKIVEQRIELAQREYASTLRPALTIDAGSASANEYTEYIARLREENERLRAALMASAANPVQRAGASPITSQDPYATSGGASQGPLTAGSAAAGVQPQNPAGSVTQQPAPVPPPSGQIQQPTRAASQPAQPPPAPQMRRHVVQPKDTLFNIARQYYGSATNAQIEAIVNANRDKLQSRNTPLRAGMELKLP